MLKYSNTASTKNERSNVVFFQCYLRKPVLGGSMYDQQPETRRSLLLVRTRFYFSHLITQYEVNVIFFLQRPSCFLRATRKNTRNVSYNSFPNFVTIVILNSGKLIEYFYILHKTGPCISNEKRTYSGNHSNNRKLLLQKIVCAQFLNCDQTKPGIYCPVFGIQFVCAHGQVQVIYADICVSASWK